MKQYAFTNSRIINGIAFGFSALFLLFCVRRIQRTAKLGASGGYQYAVVLNFLTRSAVYGDGERRFHLAFTRWLYGNSANFKGRCRHFELVLGCGVAAFADGKRKDRKAFFNQDFSILRLWLARRTIVPRYILRHFLHGGTQRSVCRGKDCPIL